MTVVPSPRGTTAPPSDGASLSSNSSFFTRFDLRDLLLDPPLPKAPAVPAPRPPRPPGPGLDGGNAPLPAGGKIDGPPAPARCGGRGPRGAPVCGLPPARSGR